MPAAKKTAPASSAKTPQKKDTRNYFYAVGKRKSAVAQVRLYPKGSGEIIVNNRKVEEYFFGVLLEKVLLPLTVLGVGKSYDIQVTIEGGGVAGQADAVCHGISKALTLAEETSKTTIKRAGLLTRDARVKERKKYGLKKARRSPQWAKR